MLLMGFCLAKEKSEDQRFAHIVSEVFRDVPASHKVVTSHENALLLLHHVHALVKQNADEMAARKEPSPLLWTAEDHLRHPSGSCTSYSTVLAKTLAVAGFQVRKIGLEKDGRKAIHHVIEVLADGRWVLLDAVFDLSFQRPDGQLASAKEISSHWPYYRAQTPPHYPGIYDYSSFYYTNWDRLPGAHLLFQCFPSIRTWATANEISLRLVFLNVWNWMACGFAMLGLGLWVAPLGLRLLGNHRHGPQFPQSLPLTATATGTA